jgi:hypothetical protein
MARSEVQPAVISLASWLAGQYRLPGRHRLQAKIVRAEDEYLTGG